MNRPTSTDLVTGAFSYSGAQIAKRLLEAGRNVRTLTYHPDRPHPLQRAWTRASTGSTTPRRSLTALRE